MVLVTLAMTLLLSACGLLEPRAPERSFTPEDLLIDQDVVPPGWELSAPLFPAGDDLCTTESAEIRFAVTDEQQSVQGGTYSVYRHRSAGIARRTFDKVYLATARSLGSVSEWTYRSSVAEQSHFGCDDMAGNAGVACEWGGQYEEYIVVFGVAMTSGEVSLANIEQMEAVVKVIDERMAQHLGKPLEDSGD